MISGLFLAFLPTPITFEAKAETVSSVVTRLAQVTETPLLCSPEVGRRRVIAVVKNADPLEFRAHLAQAVGAHWIQTPKGPRLEFLPKEESEIEARHRKMRIAWIRRALKEFERVEPEAWTANEARQQLVKRKEEKARAVERGYYPNENVPATPSTRAAYRLLEAMGPEALADIEWGDRRVFTSRVRGRHVTSLPQDAARSAVKKFNQEYTTLQDVLLAQPDLAEGFPSNAAINTEQKLTDPLKGEATDVTLVVTRSAFSPDLHVVVYVSAANGTIVNSSFLQLSGMWMSMKAPTGPSRELWDEVGKIKVRLSPETKEWFEFRDLRVVRPPSEAPETVRHPERFDPLDLLYTDAFRAVAEARKVNVVAEVGDLDFHNYSRIDDAASLRALFTENGENVKQDKGWLTIATADPIDTDQAALDRDILGTYLRTALQNGYDSTANFVPLARYTHGLRYHPLQTAVLWSLRLDRVSGEGLADPNYLLLVDHFGGTTQRKSYREMTSTERAELEKFLYRTNSQRFMDENSGGIPIFDRIELIPNIGFPDGLPADMTVDLKVVNEDVAVQAPLGQEPGKDHEIRIPIALAYSPPASDARFRLGKATRYDMVLGLPGRLSMRHSMNVYSTDLSKPAVTFLQLPEWFRQKVDSFRSGTPE